MQDSKALLKIRKKEKKIRERREEI